MGVARPAGAGEVKDDSCQRRPWKGAVTISDGFRLKVTSSVV